MDFLGLIGLILVILAILAFAHVIALGLTLAVVFLVIGIVLLAVPGYRRYGRTRL